MCECRHCTDSRKWTKIVEKSDVSELKTLIRELRNRLCDAETDNERYEMIMSAEWPSSEYYGNKILKNVEKLKSEGRYSE